MFTRRYTEISTTSANNFLNLNTIEILDLINNDEIQKIKSYLSDPNNRIWEIKDENGCTALHRSCFKNNYELTSLIINEAKKGLGLGSDYKIENFINEKTNEGFTALHYAASNGNIKIVELLKKYGARIESVTKIGKNILHISAESNQPSMLIYTIVNEPLDIFSVDENGSTPLHWACYSGAEESVKYLLSLKANINALDREKYTPLHLAVTNNKEKIVRLLLQNGADKNIVNEKNELPIDIARKRNYTSIINLLLDKEYNPLFTLDYPTTYIQPKDIYKKIVLLMIIIPEIVIIFLVLPLLENVIHSFANLGTFLLCLLTYIIIIFKNPGYQKNIKLIKDCQGEDNYKPLKKLIERKVDLKNYCPICYVENNDNNIAHCFICNKCVLELSHHCFWFNKCIGKKNKAAYISFIFFSFIYTFHSIFICLNLLIDKVYFPYSKIFPPDFLNFPIDRGFRVVGAAIVIVFSFFVSFPLFILFMIEMFKSCGLLGKKRKKEIDLINENDDDNEKNEFEKENIKKPLINNKNNKNNNVIDEEENEKIIDNSENENINNNKVDIPNENFPIVDGRPSNTSSQ
jgi:palmitoyltransferase